MRQCDKCRKQLLAKDYEKHMEICQKVVMHTSQNQKAPKVIEFATIDSNFENKLTKTKPRVASARPPLRKNKQQEDARPIKAQNVPKWKLQSE